MHSGLGESDLPTEPRWYDDPEGLQTHQAYWDGDKWTGAIRPSGYTPPRRFIPTWVWITAGLMIGLAWLAYITWVLLSLFCSFGNCA